MKDKLFNFLRDWVAVQHREKVLRQCGMITNCTYCNQIMQDGDGFRIDEHPTDKELDLLTCTNCKGISVWLFASVWIYIGGWQPPPAKHEVA